MRTMNKVLLMGHIGQDPELKISANGSSFVRLSVATHRQQKREDEFESVTQWHSVYVWGKAAHSCSDWLTKGSLVLVEGELRQMETKDDEDSPRIFSFIQASEVIFLSLKQGHLDNRLRSRNHDAVAQR